MSFANQNPIEHQDSGPRLEMSESETGEGVIDRKLVFCPNLSSFPTEELIRTCEKCDRFFVYCCGCNTNYGNDGRRDNGRICHHFQLLFTDGACRLNGQADATAGFGIACGEGETDQLSVPITDEIDPGQRRTSQRAELLAALYGLGYLTAVCKLNHADDKKGGSKKNHRNSQEEACWIMATDSEYVVKGMTEWLPAWKENNYRTNQNKTPANLDLFLKLDQSLSHLEKKNLKIGFWHVPRKFNTIADGLAKKASLDGDVASASTSTGTKNP